MGNHDMLGTLGSSVRLGMEIRGVGKESGRNESIQDGDTGGIPTIKGRIVRLETLPISLLTMGVLEESRNGGMKTLCFEILIWRTCGNVQGRWEAQVSAEKLFICQALSELPPCQALCEVLTTSDAVRAQTRETLKEPRERGTQAGVNGDPRSVRRDGGGRSQRTEK